MTPTLIALALACAPAPELRVGVSLHAYASWAAAVIGEAPVELRPILPPGVDAATYQPTPGELASLAELDALIVNGLGHDGFVDTLLAAAGSPRVRLIRPSADVALASGAHGEAVNPHTFLAFGLAVQQTHAIAAALAELAPRHADTFRANARAYARRLRAMQVDAVGRLAAAPVRRVVTVHDGYGYLLEELGVEVVTVVEPAHGVVPSAREVAALVAVLRRERVEVLLTEAEFPAPLVELLRREAGVRVGVLSHIASGAYTADKFEREMRGNVDTLVRALGGAS